MELQDIDVQRSFWQSTLHIGDYTNNNKDAICWQQQ
jgi:hypothetical protein